MTTVETKPEKRAIVALIREHLEDELREAKGRSAAAEEIQSLERALLMYRFLPVRPYSSADVVEPGALVEVELNGRRSWVLLVPQNGGFVTLFEGRPLQALTPQSPLGEALLGKRVGETALVQLESGERTYRLISLI